MAGSSPAMTALDAVGKKKVGRRRVPKGMGWDAASNPFWAASLGGNTTLPVGLFRQDPMIQRIIAVGQGRSPQGFTAEGGNTTVGRHRFKQRG
jgi:hypothetical protein